MGPSLTETLKNHPLWKGFPLKEWESSVVKAQTEAEAKFTDSSLLKSEDLSGFYTLSFDGSQTRWLGSKPNDISLSIGLNQSSDEFAAKDAFDQSVLNQAQSGIHLEIHKGSVREKPLALLISHSESSRVGAYAHQIRVSEGCEASVYIGFQNQNSVKYNRFRIHLEKHAQLNLLFSDVEENSLSTRRLSHSLMDIHLENGSELHLVELASGVSLGRTEIYVALTGQGSHASVSGVHMLGKDQVYDSRVTMQHLAADSSSRQSFKCVVSDQAKSVFGGKIDIARNAQRVDAGQSHKALLISPNAKAFAYPDLEVLADDVKAAHGSSIGQMDKDQIFYLKSRGLSEKESLKLLGEAFVKDVLMKNPSLKLRELSEKIIAAVLPQFTQGVEEKLRQDS